MTKSPFCPLTNLKETDECLWFPEKHNQANFSPTNYKIYVLCPTEMSANSKQFENSP